MQFGPNGKSVSNRSTKDERHSTTHLVQIWLPPPAFSFQHTNDLFSLYIYIDLLQAFSVILRILMVYEVGGQLRCLHRLKRFSMKVTLGANLMPFCNCLDAFPSCLYQLEVALQIRYSQMALLISWNRIDDGWQSLNSRQHEDVGQCGNKGRTVFEAHTKSWLQRQY